MRGRGRVRGRHLAHPVDFLLRQPPGFRHPRDADALLGEFISLALEALTGNLLFLLHLGFEESQLASAVFQSPALLSESVGRRSAGLFQLLTQRAFALLHAFQFFADLPLLVGKTAALGGELAFLTGRFGLQGSQLLLELGGFLAGALALGELLLQRLDFVAGAVPLGTDLRGLLPRRLQFVAGAVALGDQSRLYLLFASSFASSRSFDILVWAAAGSFRFLSNSPSRRSVP